MHNRKERKNLIPRVHTDHRLPGTPRLMKLEHPGAVQRSNFSFRFIWWLDRESKSPRNKVSAKRAELQVSPIRPVLSPHERSIVPDFHSFIRDSIVIINDAEIASKRFILRAESFSLRSGPTHPFAPVSPFSLSLTLRLPHCARCDSSKWGGG